MRGLIPTWKTKLKDLKVYFLKILFMILSSKNFNILVRLQTSYLSERLKLSLKNTIDFILSVIASNFFFSLKKYIHMPLISNIRKHIYSRCIRSSILSSTKYFLFSELIRLIVIGIVLKSNKLCFVLKSFHLFPCFPSKHLKQINLNPNNGPVVFFCV